MKMKFWQDSIFPKTNNLKCEIEGCRVQFLTYF